MKDDRDGWRKMEVTYGTQVQVEQDKLIFELWI